MNIQDMDFVVIIFHQSACDMETSVVLNLVALEIECFQAFVLMQSQLQLPARVLPEQISTQVKVCETLTPDKSPTEDCTIRINHWHEEIGECQRGERF